MNTSTTAVIDETIDPEKVLSFLKYTGHVWEIGLSVGRAYGRSYNEATIDLFPDTKDYVGWLYEDGLYTAYAVRNGSASGAEIKFSNLKLDVETAKQAIELLLNNL
jgi:hypothetical protein